MIPARFEYHRPTSVQDAVALLAQLGEEARPLAGGHSLIPVMKTRLAAPEHLVDLAGISSLKGIRREQDHIAIGAMATQSEMIASPLLAEILPIIRETSLLIGDPQIRYVGTIGGNVANGDPGNDMPALMMCLDAEYQLAGRNGQRRVRARAFYLGAYDTARQNDEILTEVRIPIPAKGHGYAYEKLKRKVGDYAVAAAAVMLTITNGTCRAASIGLTNVADTPLWAEAAARVLIGTRIDRTAIANAANAAEAITNPASDGHGPAEYRRKMTGVTVRRAIERAKLRAEV
jgi:carbon-monoxide dehydrogenase medium subunit